MPCCTLYDKYHSQDDIKFGTVRGGATYSFFKNSQDPDMMQAYLRMTEDDSLVSHNREGIEKVLSGGGKFAFFLESAGADYATAQNCGLTTVGGNLNTRREIEPGCALIGLPNTLLRSHWSRAS